MSGSIWEQKRSACRSLSERRNQLQVWCPKDTETRASACGVGGSGNIWAIICQFRFPGRCALIQTTRKFRVVWASEMWLRAYRTKGHRPFGLFGCTGCTLSARSYQNISALRLGPRPWERTADTEALADMASHLFGARNRQKPLLCPLPVSFGCRGDRILSFR